MRIAGRNRKEASTLPANVYLKSGTYYFVTPPPNRKWINIGKDEASVSANLNQLAAQYTSAERRTPRLGPKISLAYNKCKHGALARGIEFKITRKMIDDLYEMAGGRCQLTGIEFSNELIGKTKSRPWAPSIDRIDSSKGYALDNIRLVCVAVNFALGAWGDEVLKRIILEGYKSMTKE